MQGIRPGEGRAIVDAEVEVHITGLSVIQLARREMESVCTPSEGGDAVATRGVRSQGVIIDDGNPGLTHGGSCG
jgi:hypothetical protein